MLRLPARLPRVGDRGHGRTAVQLTIKQAAELLEVEEGQIRRWIRDRGLPAVLFNEQHRLNRIDLLVWAQENQVPVPAHALLAAEPDAASLPGWRAAAAARSCAICCSGCGCRRASTAN
jgi:excisionase family DNA binding protein